MSFKEDLKKVLRRKELFFVDELFEKHPEAELYLVGGSLRDALLKTPPSLFDLDLVIRNLSEKSIEEFFSRLGDLEFVGKTFGVYKFMPRNLSAKTTPFVDIALPRTETSTKKGGYRDFNVQADPTLSIEEDLSRRDFTVNAMAHDFKSKKIVDPYKGRADLKKRFIRAVGKPQDRFDEDYSRLLRALRFAIQLNFTIEKKTWTALKQSIANINKKRRVNGKMQYIVPREVMGMELAKMIDADPDQAHALLQSSGARDLLFPSVSPRPNLSAITSHPVAMFLILLLQNASTKHMDQTFALTGLSKLPKDCCMRIETGQIKKVIERMHRLQTVDDVNGLRASQFEKWFFNGSGALLLQSLSLIGHKHIARAAQKRKRAMQKRWAVEDNEPIPPLLSGDDILSAGVESGPKIRHLLDRARDAQLQGELMTRGQAKKWLTQQVS